MKFLLLTFFPLLVSATQVRVGVIDTGYNVNVKDINFCDDGKLNKDFTKSNTMNDVIGHGNNVTHIIAEGLSNNDYCLVSIKIINEMETRSIVQYNEGFAYASSLNLDLLNISLGGEGEDELESYLVKYMLNHKVILVAAAGNNKVNLDKNCNYSPACVDNRIVTVGCLQDDGKKPCSFSNRGKYVKVWEKGINVLAGGVTLSGTSQATARATNKIIKKMIKKKKPRCKWYVCK